MVTPTAIMGFQNVDTAIRSKVSLHLSLCVSCKASLGAGGGGRGGRKLIPHSLSSHVKGVQLVLLKVEGPLLHFGLEN